LTEVHVGQILRRLKVDPDASIESATLRAIARGAKVSEAWLLTGKGSPDDADDVRPYEAHSVTPRAMGVRDRVVTYGTDRPFWRDLPDWPQLLAAAKLEDPDMPEAVWEKIERDLQLVLDDDDGLVVIARVSSSAAQAHAIRYEIARAALRLAGIPHARTDAVALARLLAGPEVVRCGRLPRGEPEKGGAGEKSTTER
jgi:hypothetical protein